MEIWIKWRRQVQEQQPAQEQEQAQEHKHKQEQAEEQEQEQEQGRNTGSEEWKLMDICWIWFEWGTINHPSNMYTIQNPTL